MAFPGSIRFSYLTTRLGFALLTKEGVLLKSGKRLLFSDFRYFWLTVLASFFLSGAASSATKPNTRKPFNQQRPPITDLYDAKTLTSVKEYFTLLSADPDLEISEELEWLGNLLLNEQRKSVKQAMIVNLGDLRQYMPVEFRWLVAAFEVDAGLLTIQTLSDIKDVTIRARYLEKGNFLGLLSAARPHAIDVPADEGDSRIRETMDFVSQSLPVFLMNTWAKLSILTLEPVSVEIERARLEWFEELSILTLKASPKELFSYVESFNNPAMRHFTSLERQFLFSEYATNILERISYRGKYKTDRFGRTVFVPGSQDNGDHRKVYNKVSEWIFEDVDFLIKNLGRLEKLGVVPFDKMFNRIWTAQEANTVYDSFSKRKYDIEAQLTAGLMLLKQVNWQGSAEQKEIVVKQVFNIIISADVRSDLINISARGFESQRIENSIYYHLLEQFYQIFLKSPMLTREQGIELLRTKTVNSKQLKDSDFIETDRLRLKLVEQHLGYEEFKEVMTKVLAKGTSASLTDQMQAASYLGDSLKEADRQRLVADIKLRFSKSNRFGFSKPTILWETDRGWPVQLVLKINPRDLELRDFLVGVIIQQKVDSVFSDGEALSTLIQAGTTTPELKAFILRKLGFISAGDTTNYFRALARLHPEAGLEISTIVYRYLKDSSKLIPIMKILLEESERNPSLLQSIETSINSDRHRSENSEVYNNRTLSGWLRFQMNKKRSSFCRAFYGP